MNETHPQRRICVKCQRTRSIFAFSLTRLTCDDCMIGRFGRHPIRQKPGAPPLQYDRSPELEARFKRECRRGRLF